MVQARLDRGRPGAQTGRQRFQHARRHLGGARRIDHPLSTDSWIPYFQEVYLDAASVPLFSKLAQHALSSDALDNYVAQLEVRSRYLSVDHPSYGKAAKRMYNIFRLDGRYIEAAFLRELFDEPATVLYQLYALVRSIEEASGRTPGRCLPR